VESGFTSHVLLFPVATGFDLAAAALGDRVGIGPPVDRPLFDQPFLDERVKVRVQPPVVDLGLVVVFEFGLDREPVRFILACDRVKQVALKSRSTSRSDRARTAKTMTTVSRKRGKSCTATGSSRT